VKVAALVSMKGGVGKTTIAVNMAYEASRTGRRTLLWDLDPQGAASFSLRIKPKVKGGARGLISRRRPVDRAVRGTDFDELDLLPADLSARHLDVVLDGYKRSTARLGRLLADVAGDYDLAVLDCPPGGGLTVEAAAEASDLLLVPTIPTPLATRALDQTHRLLGRARRPPAFVPVLSLVDRRKGLHRVAADDVRKAYPETLTTEVPDALTVERTAVERAPVAVFAPHSRAASMFAAIWDEVEPRL
jgi:chromosome partitioning protein